MGDASSVGSTRPELEHAKEGLGSHRKKTGRGNTVETRGGGGTRRVLSMGEEGEGEAGGGAVKEERR